MQNKIMRSLALNSLKLKCASKTTTIKLALQAAIAVHLRSEECQYRRRESEMRQSFNPALGQVLANVIDETREAQWANPRSHSYSLMCPIDNDHDTNVTNENLPNFWA